MKDMNWKKRIVSKINSNSKEQKVAIDLETINSIAVLGSSKDIPLPEMVLDSLSKEFDISKNSIKIMIYSDVESSEDSQVYGAKDFSFFGKVKSAKLKDFINERVDLLINYQRLVNVYGNRLNLLSQASFKAGFETSELKSLNFELKGRELSNQVFDKELVKYLNILNIC
jgi:hypothetical protein